MSTSPDAAIGQLQQDRAALVAQRGAPPAGPDQAQILQDKQAALAPVEQAITAESGNMPKPPGAAQLPQAPNKPLVDPGEYSKLSAALVAMAMIAGAKSNNWLGATASLNGALKGYMEGNQQKADTDWKRYQADYDKAVQQHKDQQQEYMDVLNNKKLSINEKFQQWSMLAAKYDDQQKLAISRRKSYDEMTKAIYDMDQHIATLSITKGKIDDQKAASTGGTPLTPQAQALKDDLRRMDQSFLSRQSAKGTAELNKTIEDWAAQGYSADDIISGRISTGIKKTEGTVLGRREGALLPVEKSITRPGGFLDQADKAVNAVDFPTLKKAGEFDKWTKEQNSDPKLSAYKAAVAELRAEYAIVLSKGGPVTDAARSESKEVVPDLITPDQFQSIKTIIKQGIEASKSGVEDSIAGIAGGKSEVKAPKPYADAAKEQRYQEWKRAHPDLQ